MVDRKRVLMFQGRRIVLLALIAVPAIWVSSPATAEPAGVQDEPPSPIRVRFATGKRTGDYYHVGVAIKAALETTLEATNRSRSESRQPQISLELLDDESGEGMRTLGSCDNLRLLLEGKADIAIVQYDVVAEADEVLRTLSTNPHGQVDEESLQLLPWPCPDKAPVEIRKDPTVVASLFEEHVLFLVRRPFFYRTFDRLHSARRKIHIGSEGTGSYHTARTILSTMGYDPNALRMSNTSTPFRDIEATISGDAAKDTVDRPRNQLAAVLKTVNLTRIYEPGKSDDDLTVNEAVLRGIVTLQGLPDRSVNDLIEQHPYYRECSVREGTFGRPSYATNVPSKKQPFDVRTICVATVLVLAEPRCEDTDDPDSECGLAVGIYNDLSDALVQALKNLDDAPPSDASTAGTAGSDERLAKTTDDSKNALRMLDIKWSNFAAQQVVGMVPDAQTEAQRKEIWRWIRLAILGLVLLSGVVFTIRRRHRSLLLRGALPEGFKSYIENPITPLLVLVIFVLSIAFAIWLVERSLNADLRSYWATLWAMAMFASGNYDSKLLKTDFAQIVGIGLTVFSLGMLAWFTAALTALFTSERLAIGRKVKDHVVVLNFRESMMLFVRILRSPGPLRTPPVHVVVPSSLSRRSRYVLNHMKGVWVHDLNAADPCDLAKLRLDRARRVIILDNESGVAGGVRPLNIVRAINMLSRPTASDVIDQLILRKPNRPQDSCSLSDRLRSFFNRAQDSRPPYTLIENREALPADLVAPYRSWLQDIPYQRNELRWIAWGTKDFRYLRLFERLLWIDPLGSEMYVVPLPRMNRPVAWECLRKSVAEQDGQHAVVLMGIFRPGCTDPGDSVGLAKGTVVMNPALGFLVEPSDHVIALAWNERRVRSVLRRAIRQDNCDLLD